MEARTDTAGSSKTKKDQGRMDASKQPAVKKPDVVAKKLEELVRLATKAQDAAETAKDAVNKVAEESGYNASAVNKIVKAKLGDRFEEKHREVQQQAELFDEVA